MKTIHLLLAGIGLLSPVVAVAESGLDCPILPADAGIAWERLDNADFTFCKAIRASDGQQVFAVMLAGDSPFKPDRSARAEAAVIDGRDSQWYRSEVAGKPELRVRETLLELDRDHVAHISVRAGSDAALAEALRTVETLRFAGTLLSSN